MNDIEPMVPLEALDPGSEDPTYWVRFQEQVMAAAAPRLAIRRAPGLSIGEAVLASSRYFVPLALTAAACAALLLFRTGPSEGVVGGGVEEFLASVQEDEEAWLPTFFRTEETVDRDVVLLAVEGF